MLGKEVIPEPDGDHVPNLVLAESVVECGSEQPSPEGAAYCVVTDELPTELPDLVGFHSLDLVLGLGD